LRKSPAVVSNCRDRAAGSSGACYFVESMNPRRAVWSLLAMLLATGCTSSKGGGGSTVACDYPSTGVGFHYCNEVTGAGASNANDGCAQGGGTPVASCPPGASGTCESSYGTSANYRTYFYPPVKASEVGALCPGGNFTGLDSGAPSPGKGDASGNPGGRDATPGDLVADGGRDAGSDASGSGISGKPVSVDVGGGQVCAVLSDGKVACWGENPFGQVGDGTVVYRSAPVAATEVTDGPVTAVSCGSQYSCALLASGKIECWGQDVVGQLGDGAKTNTLAAVTVQGITNATALSTGENHACAVLADHTVSCWGINYGVTDPAPSVSATPVSVAGLDHVTAVAAGDQYTCALRDDGGVRCWGDGSYGVLAQSSPTPVDVAGLPAATAISGGAQFMCALLTDATVSCWGFDQQGQAGTMIPSAQVGLPDPTVVAGVSNAIAVAAGDDHACALVSDGTVYCWGDNFNAALGTGSTGAPAGAGKVVSLEGVTAISAGFTDTCAFVPPSSIECWGGNQFGELGDGTTVDRATPVLAKFP
jgi:alpha-tubulin suppressor-like RCC1 family protein